MDRQLLNEFRSAVAMSGKSQRQIAREMGVNPSAVHISNVLSGKKDMKLDYAQRLAAQIGKRLTLEDDPGSLNGT